MMKKASWLLAFFCFFSSALEIAQATVQVRVNIDTQTMAVTTASGASYVWPVSTGMAGFATPRGTFGTQRMMAMAYSNIYNNAPMPHSIFFSGGYAIHGTYALGALGRPASHGCIRLAPGNAATLFSLVRAEGAVISISGTGARFYTASRQTRAKATQVAGRYKQPRAVRAAKIQRSYMAYAPVRPNAPLKAWLKHPGRNF